MSGSDDTTLEALIGAQEAALAADRAVDEARAALLAALDAYTDAMVRGAETARALADVIGEATP